VFSKGTLGNAEACRTEAEISDEKGNYVAVVFESEDGWHVELSRNIRPEEVESFNAIVDRAKSDLSHYLNRKGLNPPDDLTVAGLSLWLMQQDDETVLGMSLADLVQGHF
jgi:hypothetical protein